MGGTPNNQPDNLSSLRQDVERTTQEIRNDNPFIKKFMDDPRTKTRVITGEGENFGEVYVMGQEESSPYPNENVVEIRQRGRIPLKQSIIGEILHAAGDVDLQGNPQSPEFFRLKQEFIGNMTPGQLSHLEKKFGEFQRSGATGTNAEDIGNYLRNSYSDGDIRGHIFPDIMTDPEEREMFRRGVILSPRQREIIQEMKQVIGVPND